MSALTLYDFWRSSAAYRVRIGLNLKGLSYDQIAINLRPGFDEQLSDVFRAKNPSMRVPALDIGGAVLAQSLAILEWLEETHPAPPFLPNDALTRARVRAFAQVIACDIHPIGNIAVLGQLRARYGADEDNIHAWYRHWNGLGFAALEAMLAANPESLYCFGDAPSLADIVLVPQMANARRFNLDLGPYPRLTVIDAHARTHPAFASAAPERQPDAPEIV